MKLRQVFNIFVLSLSLMLCLAQIPKAQAQAQDAGLDPRIKALALMAVYGTTGGLLLGTAALAFDAPGRSPFVGASVGLYVGLLFGSYVVITYAIRKHQLENPGQPQDENYYPETPDSPYESPFRARLMPVVPSIASFTSAEHFSTRPGKALYGSFERRLTASLYTEQLAHQSINFLAQKAQKNSIPLFYVPIMRIEF